MTSASSRPPERSRTRDKRRTLDRYLSWCGVASRPRAVEWIRAGRVRVNRRVVRDPRTWVTPYDAVELDGRRLEGAPATELHLYHKPRGVLVTEHDPESRPIYRQDLPPEFKTRGIRAVGRLDRASAGLLILTNDTQLADRILAGGIERRKQGPAAPAKPLAKIYHLKLVPAVTSPELEGWRRGLDIGDRSPRLGKATSRKAASSKPTLGDSTAPRLTLPAPTEIIRQNERSSVIQCALREGRNRQLRRMAAAIDREVEWLVRVSIGPLTLGSLTAGQHRAASPAEIEELERQL